MKCQPFSFRFLSEDWGEFENGATWKVEEGIEKYDFREFTSRYYNYFVGRKVIKTELRCPFIVIQHESVRIQYRKPR